MINDTQKTKTNNNKRIKGTTKRKNKQTGRTRKRWSNRKFKLSSFVCSLCKLRAHGSIFPKLFNRWYALHCLADLPSLSCCCCWTALVIPLFISYLPRCSCAKRRNCSDGAKLLAGMSLITLLLLALLSVFAVSGIGMSVDGGTTETHVFKDLSAVSLYFSWL